MGQRGQAVTSLFPPWHERLIDHDLSFCEALSLKIVSPDRAGITVTPDNRRLTLVCHSAERDTVSFQHGRAKKLRVRS